MGKTGWAILVAASAGIAGLWYTNYQARNEAKAVEQAKIEERKERLLKLAASVGAQDGWQAAFEDRQILSTEIERAIVGRPLIYYGFVDDVRTVNGSPVIMLNSKIGGILGRTLKLELRADPSEVAAVTGRPDREFKWLLDGFAAAARVDDVRTVDLPDGEGEVVQVTYARAELLGIMPSEDVYYAGVPLPRERSQD